MRQRNPNMLEMAEKTSTVTLTLTIQFNRIQSTRVPKHTEMVTSKLIRGSVLKCLTLFSSTGQNELIHNILSFADNQQLLPQSSNM
jgi:hypothetical protein